MAATRSSARLALKANAMQTSEETISSPANSSNGKRKNNNAALKAPAFKKSKTQTGAGSTTVGSTANPQTTRAPSDTNADAPVPAVLSFDFNEAMRHLITVDPRFQDLFDRMPCRPFEQLEQVHPFRALSISILGQQISWKAARSITHKFIRLYSPSIPEEVTDESRAAAMQVFPTPEQVSKTEVSLLRTAGLSERKAQYIQDLAARFADGRLSTDKLLNASDEELAEMLIEVKGIGRWTVDMFAIFSLRRPDILPVGDLGVQRGLARWFLSLHSPAHTYTLSPEKVDASTSFQRRKTNHASNDVEDDALPTVASSANKLEGGEAAAIGGVNRDGDTMTSDTSASTLLPPPFTPSIQKTLSKAPEKAVPLPTGITISLLKSRLDGKKVKGAFLTPQEMTDLTESWRPYRSLGVYYMWSLADSSEKK